MRACTSAWGWRERSRARTSCAFDGHWTLVAHRPSVHAGTRAAVRPADVSPAHRSSPLPPVAAGGASPPRAVPSIALPRPSPFSSGFSRPVFRAQDLTPLAASRCEVGGFGELSCAVDVPVAGPVVFELHQQVLSVREGAAQLVAAATAVAEAVASAASEDGGGGSVVARAQQEVDRGACVRACVRALACAPASATHAAAQPSHHPRLASGSWPVRG